MDTSATVVEAPARADVPLTDSRLVIRGGTSLGGAVTGALVVYAAGLLFVLATRAFASYAGYRPYFLPIGGTHGTGLAAAIGIGAGVVAAFAWGGYTAGRMGRGRGWLNGLLAALAVGVIGAAGFGAAAVLRPGPGLDLRLHLPAGYPHIHFLVARWILLVSGTCLALLASVVGGTLGARFHTRLERRALREEAERLEARTTFADLREAMAEPAPVPGGPTEAIPPPGEGLPAHS
jgi:hypothetical protein